MPRSRPTSIARPADPGTDAAAEQAARQLSRKRDLDAVVATLVDSIPWPQPGPSRPTGRPSLLTPANAALALRAVCQGNYPTVALGLFTNRETWSEWQDRAAIGEQPYAGFVDAMARAEAYHHTRTIARIDAQSEDSWRAGLGLAERRYKAHWAPQAAPAGPSAPTVNVQVLAVSDLSGLASLLTAPTQPAPSQLIEGQILPPNELTNS